MGSMTKALVGEFIIEAADHSHDSWLKKAVFTCRVCFILLGDLKVDVVKIVFAIFFYQNIVALRVAKFA